LSLLYSFRYSRYNRYHSFVRISPADDAVAATTSPNMKEKTDPQKFTRREGSSHPSPLRLVIRNQEDLDLPTPSVSARIKNLPAVDSGKSSRPKTFHDGKPRRPRTSRAYQPRAKLPDSAKRAEFMYNDFLEPIGTVTNAAKLLETPDDILNPAQLCIKRETRVAGRRACTWFDREGRAY